MNRPYRMCWMIFSGRILCAPTKWYDSNFDSLMIFEGWLFQSALLLREVLE